MLRFDSLEQLGVRIAAMSEMADGDCRLSGDAGIEARRTYCAACGIEPEHLTVGKQVHGDRIAVVTQDDRGRGWQGFHTAFPDTDGLVTNVSGVPLGVSIADCVPLFLFDAERHAIALVHAGREGTVRCIARHAIATMRRAFDTDPKNIHAVIGPSAGPEAYEVSPELAAEFADAGLPTNGRLLDLWEANALQLQQEGVPRGHIAITGICTLTSGRFHSHRVHGNGARNLALLML